MGSRLIGGKSGSWFYNRAHLFLCEVDHEKIIISVLTKNQYDFDHIYQIGADLCEKVSSGSSGDFLQHLILEHGGYSIYNLSRKQYYEEYNQDEKFIPGSVVEVLTALIALKSMSASDAMITIHPMDIQEGSGSSFYPGDRIPLREAIYVMMMESSNTLAHAIARTIGATHNNDTA